jgi:transposase InsO family protein
LQPSLSRSLLARTLGFSRHSYYYQPRLPEKDRIVAEHIRRIYRDDDDTLGAKKLAKQISQEGAVDGMPAGKPVNHKRVARVMRTQEISSRPKKTKYRYPGKTAEPFTNLDRAIAKYEIELHPVTERAPEVLRSDILEGRLADGSKVYVTFAWRETTAQVLSLVIDWRMKADLIVATLSRIPEQMKDYLRHVIWHTDQGSQYGSDAVIDELIRHNFLASMSRAGTPTDNGYAERMVGEFKHAVLRRMSYQTIGQLLAEAERWINYYNERRPHGRLKYKSPNAYAEELGLGKVPYITVSMC